MKEMKVRTLINKLLNYDMNAPVELVILGEDEERYSCYLPDDSVDEIGSFDHCPIILHANEIKDDDESIHDLILYKHSLIDNLNKKKEEDFDAKLKDNKEDNNSQ